MIEQVIRDLKDQALAHFPSGSFVANAAWTVIGALAHNLLRWTALLGKPEPLIHLPARWPWQRDFVEALERIRALPGAA